jgi:subtilase family serine protease/C1A family cysteine protease
MKKIYLHKLAYLSIFILFPIKGIAQVIVKDTLISSDKPNIESINKSDPQAIILNENVSKSNIKTGIDSNYLMGTQGKSNAVEIRSDSPDNLMNPNSPVETSIPEYNKSNSNELQRSGISDGMAKTSKTLLADVNLIPFKPTGWDDLIVLSTTTGTNTSSSTIYDNQSIYFDGALTNSGTENIAQIFYTKIYVDDILKATYSTSSLNSSAYATITDASMGSLSAGSHTFKIVIDSENNIAESNESDNEFTLIKIIAPSSDCLNMTPYLPTGWSDKIVLSNVTGTNTSTETIYDNQTIYIDWAFSNTGTCNITQTYNTKLYIDGILKGTYSTTGLYANSYKYYPDVSLGTLAAGLHTFTIVVDGDNAVAESNESDNEFTLTKIIAPSSECLNITPYQPTGWSDKIVLSNVTGTNTSTETIYDNQTIYIDWAFSNTGTCNVTQTYNTKLYIDGALKGTYSTTGLNFNSVKSYTDVSLGTLAAGSHTFTIVVDGDNTVAESNENDNEYTLTRIITSSDGCSDLTTYKPSGWDDKIILSTGKGTNISTATIFDNQIIYLDWSLINTGPCNITKSFNTRLYVDEALKTTYNISGLTPGAYWYVNDITIGVLSAGTHTFKIVVDENNTVIESDEDDNIYTLTIDIIKAEPNIYVNPKVITINHIPVSSSYGPSYVFVDNSKNNPKNLQPQLLSEIQEHSMGSLIPDSVINYWNNRRSIASSQSILPPALDWSNNDSPVKNQGACSSCWAFATAAFIENLGNQNDLSEQVLVSCSGAGNCSSGYDLDALKFFQSTGVPEESCYAYTGTNGSCSAMCSPAAFRERILNVSNYLWGLTTVEDLRSQLQNGPIVVRMLIPTDNTFDGYMNGIYNYNGGTISSSTRGHNVLLVGYDDNQQCFKAKNSWGPQWGEYGYFRIAYDDVTDDIQFGSYAINGSGVYDQYISMISNTGHKNLTILSISDDADWLTMSGYPTTSFSIAPSGSQNLLLDVNWSMVGSSEKTATITVVSDDPDESEVTILVTAIPYICDTPLAPVIGTITQPSCDITTGSVLLNSLPSTGTWTVIRNPGGISTLGTGTSWPIAGLEEGTYTFTVTTATGCTSDLSNNLVINAPMQKPATPVITLNGNTLHSDATNGNQWYDQNGLINNATNQDYKPVLTGNYYVMATLNGCITDASNIIYVITTGTQQVENNKTIKVYPNPVTDELILEMTDNNEEIDFEILNSMGQVVYRNKLFEKTIVHTSTFSAGVYIIKFDNGKIFEFKRIIKQ